MNCYHVKTKFMGSRILKVESLVELHSSSNYSDTLLRLKSTIFWDVSSPEDHQHFKGMRYLHIQGWRVNQASITALNKKR